MTLRRAAVATVALLVAVGALVALGESRAAPGRRQRTAAAGGYLD